MGLCERCKKAQATFHLTNIDSTGEKNERHLCERCATEEGLLHVQKPTVNINDILENFVSGAKTVERSGANPVCEECGISYVEFRNQGLLGCPHDYEAFREQLAPLLRRAHDNADHHVGKVPKSVGTPRHTKQQDIRKLKRLLEEAVSAEDYERAAELRDRIRELEDA